MGFIALALIGAGAFAALAWLGVARSLWSMAGAALFLGAAGYAWQGRPLLPAAPTRPARATAVIDPQATALRDTLLGRYTADAAYLVAADAMTRAGDTRAAARVTMAGVRKLPRSFILWTWAGVTLAADADDQVTPPALLAFRQAARLAPEHPAPPFYAGMAYVRAGQFGTARAYWRRAVALAPAGTSYRREIAVRLALLERLLASGAVR
jgi:cytochrome c-type biogenesis protein CcmH/NrfG